MSPLQPGKSLTRTQMVAYALPTLPVAFLIGPIGIIQGIYAKHFGLTLTTIATVLLVSRLFDAVSDPIVGYLSDRYHSYTGSRKPFVACGGILFVISSYFLYVPPTNVSATYFLVSFLAFYLAYTLFDIPHNAWGGELATTPEEKNSIYSWRVLGGTLGVLMFYSVPLLPIFETNAFTPQSLQWAVLVAGITILPAVFVCVIVTPNEQYEGRYQCLEGHIKRDKHSAQTKNTLWQLLLMIIDNKPFLLFLAAFFLSGSSIGMWFSMLFVFVDSYLGLGEHFALISILSTIVAMALLGCWRRMATYLGKQLTWILAIVLAATGIQGTGMLAPGEASFLSLLLVMTLISSAAVAINTLAPSLLSDIIDYNIWKHRIDCSATYFSIFSLVNKANIALGGAFGLALTGWYGFDPTATTYSQDAIFGLRLSIAWLPAPIMLFSAVFIALIPINAHRHAIIRKRLNAKAVRAGIIKKMPDVPDKNQDTSSDIASMRSY